MSTSDVNAVSIGDRANVTEGYTGELYNGYKVLVTDDPNNPYDDKNKAFEASQPVWRTELGTKPMVSDVQRGLVYDRDGNMGYVKAITGGKYYFEQKTAAEVLAIDKAEYDKFFNTLSEITPVVNTLRLNVNGKTFDNPYTSESFKYFVEKASASGYKVLFQYTDGGASNSSKGADQIGIAPEAGAVNIDRITEGWKKLLNWLDNEASSTVRNNFYGFELLNEPINYTPYGKDAAGKVTYVQKYVNDMKKIHDLLLDQNGQYKYGDKKVLVGGLGASGDFNTLDLAIDGTKTALTAIREMVGSKLVWSVHSYSNWNGGDNDVARFDSFLKRIEKLGTDDVLLTETNANSIKIANPDTIITNNIDYGALDYSSTNTTVLNELTDYKTRSDNYIWARSTEFLEDKGIGAAWWGMSEPLLAKFYTYDNAGNLFVNHNSVAFAINAWVALTYKAEYNAGLYEVFEAGNIAIGYHGNDNITLNNGKTAKLYGGYGHDDLRAGSEADFLFGNRGNDRLEGRGGDDLLMGGREHDLLFGGDGNDFAEGGAGNDIIYGGNGDDDILGGDGYNELTGGAGNDAFVIEHIVDIVATNHKTIIKDFTIGSDKISVESLGIIGISAIADFVYADGKLTFTYDNGKGLVEVLISNPELAPATKDGWADHFDFSLDSRNGIHVIGWKDSPHVNTTATAGTMWGSFTETLQTNGTYKISDAIAKGDILVAGNNESSIRGGGGDDIIYLGGKKIAGGWGASINTGDGKDIIVWSPDNGSGAGSANSTFGFDYNGFTIGEDKIDVSLVPNFDISKLTIHQSAGGRYYIKHDGTDFKMHLALGTTGMDFMAAVHSGTEVFIKNSPFIVHGTMASEIVRGTVGGDLIVDNDGNDTIYGEQGNDVIIFGKGLNVINGGTGADTYVITDKTVAGAASKISWFQKDVDQLDFSRLGITGKDQLTFTGDNDHVVISSNILVNNVSTKVEVDVWGLSMADVQGDISGFIDF